MKTSDSNYIADLYIIEKDDGKHYFSANGVPWPLDDYLQLSGKPTTEQIAEIIKKWGFYK